jgi:hypothetical protein
MERVGSFRWPLGTSVRMKVAGQGAAASLSAHRRGLLFRQARGRAREACHLREPVWIGTRLARAQRKRIGARAELKRRSRTVRLALLALCIAFASPVTGAEPSASAGTGTASSACKALYLEKVRAARDALVRHDSAQAASYLLAAKEALSDCVKDVRKPNGAQDPEGTELHLRSEVRPALDTPRGV